MSRAAPGVPARRFATPARRQAGFRRGGGMSAKDSTCARRDSGGGSGVPRPNRGFRWFSRSPQLQRLLLRRRTGSGDSAANPIVIRLPKGSYAPGDGGPGRGHRVLRPLEAELPEGFGSLRQRWHHPHLARGVREGRDRDRAGAAPGAGKRPALLEPGRTPHQARTAGPGEGHPAAGRGAPPDEHVPAEQPLLPGVPRQPPGVATSSRSSPATSAARSSSTCRSAARRSRCAAGTCCST